MTIRGCLSCWNLQLYVLWPVHGIIRWVQRWQSRDHLISCENTKKAKSCWTTIDRRMLEPTKKRYPASKGKGEAATNGKRGQLHLKSDLIPARDAWRAQTKPCVHQDGGKRAGPHRRLRQTWLWLFEGLLQRHESAVACHRDRGSSNSSPGSPRVWH